MLRMMVLAVAFHCVASAAYAEPAAHQASLLGLGTEKLLHEVEDPSAFLAYRQRIEDRRSMAPDVRAEMTAMKLPARGKLPIVALNNPLRLPPHLLQMQANQRMIEEQQRRIARAQEERQRQWERDFEALVRKFNN